jgi:hypothetical protein
MKGFLSSENLFLKDFLSPENLFLRIAFLFLLCIVLLMEIILSHKVVRLRNLVSWFLGAWAVVNIGFLIFLWFNHISFPLNLDLMEGTILQHFHRAASLEAIYPQPTPSFVPLAYNPLYYYLAVPFAWIFGVNLFALRLVAILGTLLSGTIIFCVAREKTSSNWWGLLAVGLFAAAYRAMDAYLDTAHSDSWLLCSALAGTYVIDRSRSRAWNLVGMGILVTSFWFKQHGAFFAIGALLYLTWRQGLRSSAPYWVLATVLGPLAYIAGGPRLFGSQFLYFTWEVPRRWSELNFKTFLRYFGFSAFTYPILACFGLLTTLRTFLKARKSFTLWHMQFIFAALTGFMGTLDAGSSNNVFIPMGAFFIVVGTIGLHEFLAQAKSAHRFRLSLVGIGLTFALLIYDPSSVLASPRAGECYRDLTTLLQSLDGKVYAPWLGQLQDGFVLYPAAHWVALEDMVRGPGRDTRDQPSTRQLLWPALKPEGNAFILANYTLDGLPVLDFLNRYYFLEQDFKNRFRPLRVLPKRTDHGWPRYLYRYGSKVSASQNANRD